MQSKSVARELSLLILGQISDKDIGNIKSLSIDNLLYFGFDTLLNHWREQLDSCASQLVSIQQKILEVELIESDKNQSIKIREDFDHCIKESEIVLNGLSESIEMSKLLAVSHQNNIREDAMQRVTLVVEEISEIDSLLNNVMEGWRLKRLPRIDQDILRLAFVDIKKLKTPIPVACNEAVNLANRYSDQQGRKMINGILRRLQKASPSIL